MIPFTENAADLSLLAMRLVVALVFGTSGWNHLKDPKGRAKSIGMSVGFTAFLGVAEVAGALGLTFGVLTQLAALGLIVVSLGAIGKKVVEWKTGFWGKNGDGWHYDLLFLVMNLVILTTAGGSYVLLG